MRGRGRNLMGRVGNERLGVQAIVVVQFKVAAHEHIVTNVCMHLGGVLEDTPGHDSSRHKNVQNIDRK
jgi:hypothetical protein